MYHDNLLEAFRKHLPILPTDVRYHNPLIDRILENEERFLAQENEGINLETLIAIDDASDDVIDVYNNYQLLKAEVLENPALMKYDAYFKTRKRPNGSTSISSHTTYETEELALQNLFVPFFILKELLQGQAMMPKFPYHATIQLKVGQQTKSTLAIACNQSEGQIDYQLTVQCSTKAVFYHAFGLAIGHGSYFDNLDIRSNLQKNLHYFD